MYNHPPEGGKTHNKMKTLKLEVGKTYRSREGEEVKIVGMGNKGWDYWEGSNGEWYYEGGKWSYVTKEHPKDLIEEVTETRHTFDIPDGVKKITVSQVGNCIVVEMVPEKEPKPKTMQVEEITEKEQIDKFLKAYADGVMWSREQLRWLIENYLKHREGGK